MTGLTIIRACKVHGDKSNIGKEQVFFYGDTSNNFGNQQDFVAVTLKTCILWA